MILSTSQIKNGALLSYINIFLTILVSLLFTPFMIRYLGKAEYGLYMLLGSIVGYMAILDLGFGNTIIRYVAKYRAENDRIKESNLVTLCLFLYGIIAFLTLIIGSILYFNLGVIFKNGLNPLEIAKAKTMFLLMVFNIAIHFPLYTFSAIMSGYEQFVIQRTIAIIRVIVRTLALCILLTMGYKAITIIIVDTILNIIMGTINIFYVLMKLKIRFRIYYFDFNFLKEITGFSFFIFLNLIVDQVFNRTDQVILGMNVNTSMVAVYAVGITIITFYKQISTAVSNIFLPRLTKMVVENVSVEKITDYFIRTGRVQLIILGYVLVGFILFGQEFIRLWVGKDFSLAWWTALIVMIPLTVPLFQNVGIQILQAKNMHAFRSISYLIIAIINIIVSVLLVKPYGGIGVAVASAGSLIIGNIIIINLYYHYKVHLNIPRFFKEVMKRLFLSITIAALVGAGTLFLDVHSWKGLLLRGFIYTAAYVVMIWRFGANEFEKGILLQPLNRLKNRLSRKG